MYKVHFNKIQNITKYEVININDQSLRLNYIISY
jgi:hypothetical protein